MNSEPISGRRRAFHNAISLALAALAGVVVRRAKVDNGMANPLPSVVATGAE
jgi:hypothetical protein